jgi:hypothetical protein
MKRLIVILIVGCLLGAGAVNAAPPAPYTNLLTNGSFSSGFSGWTRGDNLQWDYSSGTLEAWRTSGPGSFRQSTAFSASVGDKYNINLRIGNRSAAEKSVTVYLHDVGGFSGAFNCVFTVPANTALQPYRVQGVIGAAWTNATFEVYVNTADSLPALLFDDISLELVPGAQHTNTVCTSPPAPTPTPTPTPNFYSEFELSEGNAARVENTVTAGDYVEILLLFVLLVSLWGIFLLRELRGEKS